MTKLRNFSTEWKQEIADSSEIQNETKTKWQRKTTTSDYVTPQEMTQLNFNNLVVGKNYRVTLYIYFNNSNNEDTTVTVYNNNATEELFTLGLSQTLTGTMQPRIAGYSIFTYTGSTGLRFFKDGNGGRVFAGSFAILEELPNHEVTTQWT